MRNIIKSLGYTGALMVMFATAYFIELYSDFTQLILTLGIAGLIVLSAFLYIYNWIQKHEKESKDYEITHDERLDGIDTAIDLTRDWVRDLEGKKK